MSRSPHRPQEDDKPSRRSWRGGGGGNGASRTPAATFGWRQGRAPTNYAARKWLLGVPMIVGVIGLFVAAWYVIVRQPPPTPLVCLLVTDYEAPFEPQAFAQEDVELLQKLFTPELSAGPIAIQDPESVVHSKASDKSAFLAQVQEAVGRQSPGRNKPVLIYLSAQGLVNDSGQACLVMAADRRQGEPQTATPSQILPTSRLLPVEELVDQLAKFSSPEHPVVLLLDAVRWDRNWRLGIAANDFAAKLAAVDLGRTGRENIAIVSSTASDKTSTGEFGLIDPRRGLTVFGQYAARGLAGAADVNNDDAITLAEFEAYLNQNLQAVAARRGRIQRPSVIAKAVRPELQLASADDGFSQAASETIDTLTFKVDPGWLTAIHAGFRQLGEMQEGRASDEPTHATTLLWEESLRQHWQHELRKCLAGKAYVMGESPAAPVAPARSTAQPSETDELWLAANVLVPTATDGRVMPPSYSLPLALGSVSPSDEAEQRGRAALQALLAPPMPPGADGPAKTPDASPAELAWAAWDHSLSAGPLSAEQQAKVAKYLADAGSLLPVELRTLARFSAGNLFLPAEIKAAERDLASVWAIRNAAERAAFLSGEPRVLPLFASGLDQYDSQRRRVEDRLFLATGKVEGDSLASLAKVFANLEAESVAAAAALAARDRAFAELPYLLEWAIADQKRVTEAATLLMSLAALQAALDAPRPTDPAAATDWLALGLTVKTSHEALRAAYTDQWKTNIDQSPETGFLGQFQALEQLLATPLANLSERQNLWNIVSKVIDSGELEPSAKSDAASFDPQAAATMRSDGRAAAQRLLTQWLAIWQRDKEAPPPFATLADRAFGELAPFDEEAIPEGASQELARREPLCRAFAPWLTLRPSSSLLASSSIQQRAEHAAYDYYAWQAQRALDDFHGSGDQPAVGNLPPFALAAASLVTFAEQAYFPHTPAKSQRELLAARVADARRLAGVTLRWPSRPLATGQTDLVVERWPQDSLATSLPTGEAAIRIAGDWQEVQIDGSGTRLKSPAQWLGAVKPSDPSWPASLRFVLSAEQPTVTPEVAYYYRGHAVRLSQQVRRLEPLYVLDSASPGPTGKLTVLPTLSKAHVVIVLDCSASMAPWMGDANQAVRTVIDRLLLKADDVQVSLVLFAHRRSKDVELTGTVVKWKWNAAFGPDDPSRTLFNDYAVAWRGADGADALDAIIGRADGMNTKDPKVKATGLTPLFSALSFALSDGFTDSDAGSRHLVIISDGDDYVQTRREWELSFREKNKAAGRLDAAIALLPMLEFRPPWPMEEEGYNSIDSRDARADLVKKGIETRKPNVYLFDLSKEGELAGAAALAGLGAPIAVKSPTELANAVLRRMGVFDYTLDDQDEGTELTGRTTQTRVFDNLPTGTYTLRLAGQSDVAAPLRIGGGEALEVGVALGAGASRSRFEFLPQEPPLLDAAARGRILLGDVAIDPTLASRLKSYDVQCRAERAQKGSANADHCTFELVLQNGAGKEFTPRPVELWVEILPVGTSRAGRPYVFCNPFATKNTRSPVYELIAPHWPESADKAQVSVWVRMQPTQSREAIVDASFVSAKQLPDSAAEPGVQFQFEAQAHPQGATVKVTELFGHGAMPNAWHFVVPTPNQGVSSIRRTYYDGQVEHQFAFGVGNVEDAEQRRFLAMPIAAWKKFALGLDDNQPLVVQVPD